MSKLHTKYFRCDKFEELVNWSMTNYLVSNLDKLGRIRWWLYEDYSSIGKSVTKRQIPASLAELRIEQGLFKERLCICMCSKHICKNEDV